MDYSYGKNLLNFVADSTQNGHLTAILDLLYSILHMGHMEAPPSKCQ